MVDVVHDSRPITDEMAAGLRERRCRERPLDPEQVPRAVAAYVRDQALHPDVGDALDGAAALPDLPVPARAARGDPRLVEQVEDHLLAAAERLREMLPERCRCRRRARLQAGRLGLVADNDDQAVALGDRHDVLELGEEAGRERRAALADEGFLGDLNADGVHAPVLVSTGDLLLSRRRIRGVVRARRHAGHCRPVRDEDLPLRPEDLGAADLEWPARLTAVRRRGCLRYLADARTRDAPAEKPCGQADRDADSNWTG